MTLLKCTLALQKTFVANDLPRREELYLEGANYSRLAAEREAVLHSMEVKQANVGPSLTNELITRLPSPWRPYLT